LSSIEDTPLYTIIRSKAFSQWLAELADMRARARIAGRLLRLEDGHYGDVKPVGDGVSEMRIDVGPGYRIYFTQRGRTTVILLCAGDKGSQKRDIERAKMLAKEWKEQQR
jgi:putative addiction module killer protein